MSELLEHLDLDGLLLRDGGEHVNLDVEEWRKGCSSLTRGDAQCLCIWLQRFLHKPVIVERPREFGVFASDSPPALLAAAVVTQLREDLVGPVPAFRLSQCMVQPSLSLDADHPDEIRISAEFVGYWDPSGGAVRT